MKKFIALLFIFALSAQAHAWTKYDWTTGNMYNGYNLGNNSYLYGFNPNTGSNWSTYSTPNYNYGFDSKGNHWNYYPDATGYYYNYGTGRTCIGKGALRQCY